MSLGWLFLFIDLRRLTSAFKLQNWNYSLNNRQSVICEHSAQVDENEDVCKECCSLKKNCKMERYWVVMQVEFDREDWNVARKIR